MSDVTHAVVELTSFGWVQRPSGRWVHPSLPVAGCRDRLRVFTEGEALTTTDLMVQRADAACDWCDQVHD